MKWKRHWRSWLEMKCCIINTQEYCCSFRSRHRRSRELHVYPGEVTGCTPSHPGQAHDSYGCPVQQSWWVTIGTTMEQSGAFCLYLFSINYQNLIKFSLNFLGKWTWWRSSKIISFIFGSWNFPSVIVVFVVCNQMICLLAITWYIFKKV